MVFFLILAVLVLIIFLLPILGLSFGLTAGIYGFVTNPLLKWGLIVIALLFVIKKLGLWNRLKAIIR